MLVSCAMGQLLLNSPYAYSYGYSPYRSYSSSYAYTNTVPYAYSAYTSPLVYGANYLGYTYY